MPLLSSIGIEPHAIRLEQSFSIRLGRGVYDVKSAERDLIGGRLDILCLVHDRPFLIIELKAEDVPIDKVSDVEQGLSYARLLQPMAPYVMVSNGQKTYLYEALHGTEILPTAIQSSGYSIDMQEEISLRYMALKHFTGYSLANLRAVCQSISEFQLSPFRSIPGDSIEGKLAKKYVPELFVTRKRADDVFSSFLKQAEKACLAITGESGVGKTNIMISLFEHLSDNPAIFYSGTLLGRSFLTQLQIDFNLEFSVEQSAIGILRKIHDLIRRHRTQIVFFIDALDEWVAEDTVEQLGTFITACGSLGMKVVVSCKDLLWKQFLVRNGFPSALARQLFDAHQLQNFSEDEEKNAMDKFRELLHIGHDEKVPPAPLNNPFALRVAYEVAYFHSRNHIATESERVMMKHYVEQKMNRSPHPDRSWRYVVTIANQLFATDNIHQEEGILRDHLNLKLDDEIDPVLFLNNLLYRNSIDHAIYVGFYFSKIRDFIIVEKVLRLPLVSDAERVQLIEKAINSYIGENAINFYLRNISGLARLQALQTLLSYDIKLQTSKSFRLLSTYPDSWYSELTKEMVDLLFQFMQDFVATRTYDFTIENDLEKIIQSLGHQAGTENLLIDMLIPLFDNNKSNSLFYTICRSLSIGTDSEATRRLQDLLINRTLSGELRRFVVDALENRQVDDRDRIFRVLLQEEIEAGQGPYFYARNWYNAIETKALRDELLILFDSQPPVIQKLLAETFFYSTLDDTASLLFERFQRETYPDHVTWWLCRAICTLDYAEAIPTFVKIIKSDPASELSGHLMIGLGDMKASAIMENIFAIIVNLPSNFPNLVWLTHFFIDVATPDDLQRLHSLALISSDKGLLLLAADVLAGTKDHQYFDFILGVSSRNDLDGSKRSALLNNWLMHLQSGEGSTSGMHYIKHFTGPSQMFTEHQLQMLYGLLAADDGTSTIALAILLNFETDRTRLAGKIRETLPRLHQRIELRRIAHLSNSWILGGLAIELNGWLRQQFFSRNFSSFLFLFNCLQLAVMFGDHSVLEAIETNRAYLIANIDIGENEGSFDTKYYFNEVCQLIRTEPMLLRRRSHI